MQEFGPQQAFAYFCLQHLRGGEGAKFLPLLLSLRGSFPPQVFLLLLLLHLLAPHSFGGSSAVFSFPGLSPHPPRRVPVPQLGKDRVWSSPLPRLHAAFVSQTKDGLLSARKPARGGWSFCSGEGLPAAVSGQQLFFLWVWRKRAQEPSVVGFFFSFGPNQGARRQPRARLPPECICCSARAPAANYSAFGNPPPLLPLKDPGSPRGRTIMDLSKIVSRK